MVVDFILFVIGALTLAELSLTVPMSSDPELPHQVDFNSAEPYAVFFLAVGSVMTAMAFWGLLDIQ